MIDGEELIWILMYAVAHTEKHKHPEQVAEEAVLKFRSAHDQYDPPEYDPYADVPF